jgi:hypothetical protein
MRIRLYNRLKGGNCLVCQQDVGIFRGLTKKLFCCTEHELQYLAKLKEIAVLRLDYARPRSANSRIDPAHVIELHA